ncbi:MAG: four helix bundle protein [Candidatus Liptonbacteria bacterium]|nr:four helix bundle protein [Candidatus Liptonbacteria bacterium]
MENEKQTIKTFTDLRVWQEAHFLVLLTYKITKKFPKEELFSLVNQMCRAAVSITSNIAEGFSRQYFSEKVQFYCIAQGSNTELQNQYLVARDVGYISFEECKEALERSINVQKMLNGLIKKSRAIHNS